jgi:hypothetical protein
VVELRKEFGLGFNVWFQPVAGEFAEALAQTKTREYWSVPSQAMEGDLLLFYRAAPDSFVGDVFRLAGPVEHVTAQWKAGKDWMGRICRVAKSKAPLHLSEMREDRILRDAGFVRGSMRGRYRATSYWPHLYRMILDRNPAAQRVLKAFEPARVL